jgi:formylglycine-generating enzyme required for sulfatase activity
MNPKFSFRRLAMDWRALAAFVLACGVTEGRTESGPAAGDARLPEAMSQQADEMVLVSGGELIVGTSLEERRALARRFGCDPTWLNDDLERHATRLAPFWIDRFPVSNEQYAEFAEATGAPFPWPGGQFAADAADHPVVGISYYEAAAYAAWAGKRLPTTEEWEAAIRSGTAGLFPWGDDWPGPVRTLPAGFAPDWRKPATERLGTGRHGRSAVGMEDFVQQVCEWTQTTMPHHDSTFVAVKGTSWLNEDAVNFRTAATSWASAFFATPWIGFRCAFDGNIRPAARSHRVQRDVSRTLPEAARSAAVPRAAGVEVCLLRNAPADINANLLDWDRLFLGGSRAAPIPRSRGFLLLAPPTGPWPVCLFLAEALSWKGALLMAGLKDTDPALQEGRAEGGRPTYSLHFPEIDVAYEFIPGDDYVDLRTTITNKSGEAGEFAPSSCFSLTNHPVFYDCEMVRTYQWTQNGGFIPLRQIPRPGDCVRWIEPSDSSRYGGPRNPGTMAVVSRDGRWTFASVRFEEGAGFRLAGNTWLNCLHTDAAVTIAAHASRTTRQRLYFLKGDLAALQARIQHDLPAR